MEVSGKVRPDWEVCEPCRLDGTSTRADGFCEDCEEYMCKKCFRHHLKSKGSRNHVLGSMSQGQAQGKEKDQGTQPCQKHSDYKLRYYCRKHDKVACGDCIIAEHTGCKMEFIQDVAKEFESTSEFIAVANQIKCLENEYTENKRKQEMNRRENTSMTENVLAEIRRFRYELNEYLDNAEKEIVMESKMLSKENDVLISELETKINQMKVELDDISATLNTSLYKGEILFIRFVECKRRVSDAEQSLSEIKKKNYIKTFTFRPEESLADLMASKVKLGALIIATSKSEETSSARKESTTQSAGSAAECSVLFKPEMEDSPAFSTPVFKDPDPRAKGFDVGKRVQHKTWKGNYFYGLGTVTSVDPDGSMYVKWDNGSQFYCRADAGGDYWIELV